LASISLVGLASMPGVPSPSIEGGKDVALTLLQCTEGGPSLFKLQNTFTALADKDITSVKPAAHACCTLIKHAVEQV